MEKAIKEKWLKALRSGDYKQGVNSLKDDSGCMCCLGVLCEITKKETGGDWDEFGEFYSSDHNGNRETLPSFVMDHVGIHSDVGELNKSYSDKKGNPRETLVDLNDGGLSFKQIANIIERNF